MFRKKITKEGLRQLRELSRALNAERFKLEQVKQNTALVHKGQEWMETQEGIVKLLENAVNQFTSQELRRAGIRQGEPVNVDLNTGKIYNAGDNKKDTSE